MAVQLDITLDKAYFSKNRIVAHFSSDSVIFTGIASVNELYFTSFLNENDTFSLRYGTQQIIFTAKISPTQNGNEVPAGNGDALHLAAMLPYLQANSFISQDFTVYIPITNSPAHLFYPSIEFLANVVNSKYNFLYTQFSSGFSNIILGAINSDFLKNHCLRLQVYLSNQTSFDKIYDENLPIFNQDGKILINLSSILNPELAPDFPTNWDTLTPWISKNTAKQFYLKFAEGFGSFITFSDFQSTPTTTVSLGGTSFLKNTSISADEWIRQSANATDDRALRYGSPTRWTLPDEPQYLTFQNTRDNYANISLRVGVEFENNTTQHIIKNLNIAWPKGQRVTIPASFFGLEIPAIDLTKRVRSYWVSVYANGQRITDEYRYVVNYGYYQHRQYFVYLNSLGAWDTLFFYGRQSFGFEATNKEIERYLPFDYSTNQGEMSDVFAHQRSTFVARSGYNTKANQYLCRDFLLSTHKYVYDAGRCIPISVKSKSMTEGKEDDNMYLTEFEYSYSFNQTTI